MIKLLNSSNVNKYTDKTYLCEFYADTKAEVTSSALGQIMDINAISAGSTIYTKSLDVGVFGSDHSVTWG